MSQIKDIGRRFINWAAVSKERAKSGHALFGPSTLPRVFRCVGSVRFCLENDWVSSQSDAAQEGSDYHDLAANCLLNDLEAISFAGKLYTYMHHGTERTFTPTEESCNYVQEYIDWCTELPGDHFVETRLSLEKRMPVPHQFGSTDHGAIYYKTLVDTDLKFGLGVTVYAEENEQAMAYALALYDEWSWMYDIEKIVLRIAQPRKKHWDVWECSVKDLLAWADKLYAKIEEAIGPDPKLTPGEKQCEFCPASGRCRAQKNAFDRLVAGDFANFDAPQSIEAPIGLAEIGKLLERREEFKQLLKAWEKRAFEAMRANQNIPDDWQWKIVESKSNRKFKDEGAAAKWLKKNGLEESELYDRFLITPAQAEKKLKGEKKKELGALVDKPPGKPMLAPLSDKRSPYMPASGDFDDFEDEPIDDGLGD